MWIDVETTHGDCALVRVRHPPVGTRTRAFVVTDHDVRRTTKRMRSVMCRFECNRNAAVFFFFQFSVFSSSLFFAVRRSSLFVFLVGILTCSGRAAVVSL